MYVPEIKKQLLNDVKDFLNRCRELHDNTIGDALCDLVKDRPPETDLGLEDSVSQVASCQGAMSTKSIRCSSSNSGSI